MGADVLALGAIAKSASPHPRTHVPALTSGGFALVTHRIGHVCRVAASARTVQRRRVDSSQPGADTPAGYFLYLEISDVNTAPSWSGV